MSAVQNIDCATLSRWLAESRCTLVDVREVDEFNAQRIPGSELRPLSKLSFAGLDTSKPIVFHCKAGKRSLQAAQQALTHLNVPIHSLTGGIDAWAAAGLPTTPGKSARR